MQLLCIEAGKYAQFSVHLSMYLFVQCKSKTNTNSFTHSQFMFHYAYTEPLKELVQELVLKSCSP